MVLSKEKNFYKAILSIVIPITFQNLISVSVNMADTIMLGTLGEIELSASSIGGQLFFILMVLLMGIGSGANVMCAQYFGKEDKININKVLSLAYLLAILLSLSCLIIALFFPKIFMMIFTSDNKVIEKVDTLPFNQSKLYIGYRLNDLSYHELNHVLRVYNTILGTMNDSLLFNIVREEHSLCYTVGSYYTKYNPSLTIYAGINKVNYEETVKLIKECVNLMSDKKTVERLFNSSLKTINTYLNNYYDDVTSQINEYYRKEFERTESVEELKENIDKVTIDEVINLNKKITLSTIYLLRGEL